MRNEKLIVWRLRKGLDRRFRSGHPWVYSNELMESPKGVSPGALVELQDPGGKFLARGFGNPHSLIAFRELSRNPEMSEPDSPAAILGTLKKADRLRTRLGFQGVSRRLCFGEADGIPGLVIDQYALPQGQVFVVQAHTAGADRIASGIEEILEKFVDDTALWSKTAIVLRNDLAVREREGLKEAPPQVIKEVSGLNLSSPQILIKSVLGNEAIPFHVDLIKGQKTGFFLDQYANIQLAALRFKTFSQLPKIRILDLCSYVGQWGTQLAHVFKNTSVEVVSVDASATALEFAKKNVQTQGAHCEPLKADVLKGLGDLPDSSFDLIISDPPAFIKTKKDIPTGTHAYLQLNTQVFRLLKKESGVVCCSCSALLEEESFAQVLEKAMRRNSRSVSWIGRGSQSPDHPALVGFPEGRYLKCWVGLT